MLNLKTQNHDGLFFYLISLFGENNLCAFFPPRLHSYSQDLVSDTGCASILINDLFKQEKAKVNNCMNELWDERRCTSHTLALTLRDILTFFVHPLKRSSRVKWRSLSMGGSCVFTSPGFRPPNWSRASFVKKSSKEFKKKLVTVIGIQLNEYRVWIPHLQKGCRLQRTLWTSSLGSHGRHT